MRGNGNKEDASLLKGSRFLLLTRNSRLPDNRRTKLDDILNFYTDLNKANELKELLPEIFQSTSKEDAEKLWSAWYKLASESNVEEITKFAETQIKTTGMVLPTLAYTILVQVF